MTIWSILSTLGVQGSLTVGLAILIVLSMLVEVSKIKLNPWTTITKWIGKRINADVIAEMEQIKGELGDVKKQLGETREALRKRVEITDERDADMHRAYILNFNRELLRDIPHTKEDFNEVLRRIKHYEDYCKEHEDYENNQAVFAIENIKENYKERLKKRDFLRDTANPKKASAGGSE